MRKVLIVEDEEIIRKGLVCTIDWASIPSTGAVWVASSSAMPPTGARGLR